MKIGVLLASYNGELFIRQQIDSILNQTTIETIYKFVVSDDGSIDNTLNIVRDYPKIDIVYNDSSVKGPAPNFINGLKYLLDCDVIFFSDQDDIWFENKFFIFCNEISKLNSSLPGVICSGLELCDSKGKSLYVSFHRHERIPIFWSKSLSNLFLQNSTPGCAMMVNKQMARKLVETFSSDVVMHDWWAMLYGALYSNIKVVQCPTVYYRQHSFNAVGASKKIRVIDFFNYFNRSLVNLRRALIQLDYFNRTLSSVELLKLPLAERRRLDDLSTLLNEGGFLVRFRLLFSVRKFKSSLGKDLLTRFVFLIFKAGA